MEEAGAKAAGIPPGLLLGSTWLWPACVFLQIDSAGASRAVLVCPTVAVLY